MSLHFDVARSIFAGREATTTAPSIAGRNNANGNGPASVTALDAGVDLLLLSWDGEQVYPVLAALLRARGKLDPATLKRSADRLQAAQATLPASPQSR